MSSEGNFLGHGHFCTQYNLKFPKKQITQIFVGEQHFAQVPLPLFFLPTSYCRSIDNTICIALQSTLLYLELPWTTCIAVVCRQTVFSTPTYPADYSSRCLTSALSTTAACELRTS
ncbi:hypothetical protein AMECASPLE_036638 [Ameca splendens]|uniref:Uncharacterized protein n=1 Tax=Ameca splendens TaxID=208324 RepID=A0ABV0ZTJ8_9TELE